MSEPNVNQRKVEVLKVWYSLFCAIMDHLSNDTGGTSRLSDAEIMQRLRQLRQRLKDEAPELEAS
jgi:hypothetical protein